MRAGLSRATVLAMADALSRNSLHPVSKALSRAAFNESVDQSRWQSTRVIETVGQGLAGAVRDGQRVEMSVPLQLRLGSAQFCGVDEAFRGTARVFLSDDQGWVASFELKEGLRPQAKNLISNLAAQGVTVQLLSGDQLGRDGETYFWARMRDILALTELDPSAGAVTMTPYHAGESCTDRSCATTASIIDPFDALSVQRAVPSQE